MKLFNTANAKLAKAIAQRCSVTGTLLKKRLWRGYFFVNFAKFLRTPFFIEHLRWMPLNKNVTNTANTDPYTRVILNKIHKSMKKSNH